MATTTGIGADREPRIALGVELEHTRPGSASVADIAIALDVLTAIVTDHPGETGPLDVDDTDIWIKALVVFEYDGAPLIVGGGGGRLGSWRVDGTPGPLSVDDTNMPKIEALVVFEYDGAPLIVGGGGGRRLGSWRVHGTPGPLSVDDTDIWIKALVVFEYDGAPLIVSGGGGRRLRSWRVDGALRALSAPGAHEVYVRALSLGSLDVVLLLPSAVGSVGAAIWKLDRILDALESVVGFPITLPDKLEARRQRAKAESLDAEADALEAEERRDAARAARAARLRHRLQDANFRAERVVVTTEDDEGL